MINIKIIILILGTLFYINFTACADITRGTETCSPALNHSRIISAGGSVTEILYFLGQENKIIALDVTSNYPNITKKKPSIGYVRGLSAEGILSMNPTLLIGENDMGPISTINQLQEVGLDIRSIPETQNEDGIIEKIYCISEIINKTNIAHDSINKNITPIVKELKEIRKKNKLQPKKIMLILSMQSGSIMVAGNNTSGHSFIQMIGGENIFNDIEGWKNVSTESIIAKNPDYILIPNKDLHKNSKVIQISEDPIFQNTNAGRNNHFIFDDGMAMLGFGPRTIKSALNAAMQINQ